VIELVPWDARWPSLFEREAERIRAALGPLARRIDHVGSTSIPGIAAKPVIDIQVTVTALVPLDALARRFGALGYAHMPSPDDGMYPFFHSPAVWPHRHHVHLCLATCPIGRATLALRDYLREHAEARDAYAVEKRRLAALHVGDASERREAYAEAKTPFLAPLIEEALRLGYPR
jgi:GrpB-like predicted nucleotidyltransferase (UPF0157 family)